MSENGARKWAAESSCWIVHNYRLRLRLISKKKRTLCLSVGKRAPDRLAFNEKLTAAEKVQFIFKHNGGVTSFCNFGPFDLNPIFSQQLRPRSEARFGVL